MFFVHGGGNRTGGTSDPLEILLALDDNTPLYDGAVLADRGDVVVVTIEYRLAALGYLVNDALAANSPTGTSGNYGITDTLEALRWVQRNIEAFGGDPERVLLFGQSRRCEGRRDARREPRSPGDSSRVRSWRAVRRTYSIPTRRKPRVMRSSRRWDCAARRTWFSRLRSLPLSRIVLADSVLPGGAGESSMGPWVDGYIVATQPSDIINAGAHNDVPVVVGSNAAEFAEDYHNLTLAEFYDLSAQLVPPDSLPGLYAVYPLADFANPTAAYVAMLTDQTYTCVSRTFRPHDAPASVLGRVPLSLPPDAVHECARGRRRVSRHGAALPLPAHGRRALQRKCQRPQGRSTDARVLDAFRGERRSQLSGGTVWPLYDVDTDSYMRLNTTASAGTHLYDDRCNFWESLRTGD
jgi:carboxylesterase type B